MRNLILSLLVVILPACAGSSQAPAPSPTACPPDAYDTCETWLGIKPTGVCMKGGATIHVCACPNGSLAHSSVDGGPPC